MMTTKLDIESKVFQKKMNDLSIADQGWFMNIWNKSAHLYVVPSVNHVISITLNGNLDYFLAPNCSYTQTVKICQNKNRTNLQNLKDLGLIHWRFKYNIC